MHKLLITIEESGVDQSGPVQCKSSELGELMRKITELVEGGAEVRIAAYDEEAEREAYEQESDIAACKPLTETAGPFNPGYVSVEEFPNWI